MIFFENNNVNLISYLPFFMQEYREIKKIMEAEEPEFNLFWEIIRKIFNNQFIQYCNNEGIEKFEKMLNLTINPDDTLEIRIFRVITYWNSKVPFTWRVLINKMNQLCGDPSKYTLDLDNNNYILNITTKFDNEKKYNELNSMLKIIIPSNLGIKSINILNQNPKLNLKISIGIVSNYKYRI